MKALKTFTAIVLLSGVFISSNVAADQCPSTYQGRPFSAISQHVIRPNGGLAGYVVLCRYENLNTPLGGLLKEPARVLTGPWHKPSSYSQFQTIIGSMVLPATLACGKHTGGSAEDCLFGAGSGNEPEPPPGK